MQDQKHFKCPTGLSLAKLLNTWLRTFSHLRHVCYSLCFLRYSIIGFSVEWNFVFIIGRRKSLIGDMRVLRGVLYTPTNNFFAYALIPCSWLKDTSFSMGLEAFFKVNLHIFV